MLLNHPSDVTQFLCQILYSVHISTGIQEHIIDIKRELLKV